MTGVNSQSRGFMNAIAALCPDVTEMHFDMGSTNRSYSYKEAQVLKVNEDDILCIEELCLLLLSPVSSYWPNVSY